MKIFEEALNLKVDKIDTERFGILYQVGNYTVRIFPKEGKRFITCNCFNGTINIRESTLCKHKIAAILYEANETKEKISGKEADRNKTDEE